MVACITIFRISPSSPTLLGKLKVMLRSVTANGVLYMRQERKCCVKTEAKLRQAAVCYSGYAFLHQQRI